MGEKDLGIELMEMEGREEEEEASSGKLGLAICVFFKRRGRKALVWLLNSYAMVFV